MAEYYFDTETTGLNPLEDKIITIQWQRLNGFTGEPIGDLNILKEWETSERRILTEFLPNLRSDNPFDFIMVGKNLLFDFMFLSYRTKKHGLDGFDLRHWHNRVWLDIRPILVMINKGNFRGYDRVLDKTGVLSEVNVHELYKDKKWPEILRYIQDEATTFIEGYQVLKREMPSLRERLVEL